MKASLFALLMCIVFIISGCNQTSADSPPSFVVRSLEEFNLKLNPELTSDVSLNSSGHQDATTTLSAFKNIGYPEATDETAVEDFCFTYHDDGSWYDLNYWVDGIQYRAVYQKTNEVLNRNNMTPITTCSVAGRTINLYQGGRGLVGEFYEGEYIIRIMVYGYDRLEDIDFSQFTWSSSTDNNPTA